MAMSASFVVNFSNLYTEVEKAKTYLTELSFTGTDVSEKLNKMADRFSGQKMISEAEFMAKAIDDIGGSAKLTDAEAARVNRTLTEAMEKANRTGQPVSETMRKIASETQNAADKFNALKDPLGKIKDWITGAFTVQAITAAISKFTEFTGKLTDLSARTGIGTEALQALNMVTMQSGVSMDEMAKGVSRMARNLATGDEGAVGALRKLGLSTSDLLRMSPDKAFAAIADKIATIESPGARSAAAVAIFGKTGEQYLPAFTGNLTEMIEKARQGAGILGGDMVKAGDDLGDSMDRLKQSGLVLIGEVIAPLAPAMTELAELAGTYVPMAMGFLRDVFDAVLSAMLTFYLKLKETDLAIMEMTRNIPLLGDKVGYSDEKIRLARESVDYLKGAIQGLNTDAVKPAQADLGTAATRTSELNDAFKKGKDPADKQREAIKSLVTELTGSGAIQQTKNLEAAFRQLTPEQRNNETVMREVVERYDKLRSKVGTEVSPVLEKLREDTITVKAKFIDLTSVLVPFKEAVGDSKEEIAAALPLTTKTWEETQKAHEETKKWVEQHGMLAPSLQSMNVILEESEEKTVDWTASLDGIVRAFEQMATIGGDTFRGIAQWMGQVLASSKLAKEGGLAFKQSLEGIKDGGKEAAAAVINLAAAAMSMIGALDQATGSGNTLQRTLGGVNAGFAAGNAILPGWGGAIGAVAGGLVGLARGLFGVSDETKKVRTEIASFEESLKKNLTTTQAAEAAGRGWAATTIAVRDAYMLTGRSAADAEVIVKQLWDDKNPTAARAAIEQINKVMEEAKRIAEELDRELNGALKEAVDLGIQLPQELAGSIEQLIEMGKITGDNATLFGQLTAQTEPNFKKMEEAAKKYGVELSALGPAFAQNQLNQRAKDIIDSFETMKRGGADVGGVINGMSDEINQFVQDAISSGRQVPENMKPIIEAMIEQGRLTDANGTKLTDMSGINFGPPVESAFDKIIKKLEELINKIGGGMGFDQATAQAQAFAANATTAIQGIPRNIPIRFEAGGDDVNNDGDPGFASGTLGRTGSWFKNFGQGTLTVLHGEEAVVRRDQAGAFASAFGGGGMAVDELRALRADMMAMPQHLARAVRDAILVAG